MNAMERKVDKILEAVTELQETSADMQVSIKELQGSQTGMRESISELQQITRALRDGQEETEAKVDALGTDIQTMRIDLNTVKEKMITKKDLEYWTVKSSCISA